MLEVYSKRSAIMGQNPETKKQMQVTLTKKKITPLPPRVEGESLPHLQWKCTKEWYICRKDKGWERQKDKDEESRGEKREILSQGKKKYKASIFLNKMGRTPQNYMTMKFYARGIENSRLFIWLLLTSSVPGPRFGDWRLLDDKLLPTTVLILACKCGHCTRTMELNT